MTVKKKKSQWSKFKSVELTLAGMQHRVTTSTRRMIASKLKGGPIVCKVEREPNNVHDENAIKVIIAESPYKGMHIGYVPRGVAAKYAEAMDNDVIRDVRVWLVDLEPVSADAQLLMKFRRRLKTA
jgi:hypothetical protein